MIVQLMGIQSVDFVAKETGELIQGLKLHVCAELDENSKDMRGHRCASIFTKVNLPDGIKLGAKIDLVYEQLLGSTKSRLVKIMPC